MEITVKGTAEEITSLVVGLQERQKEVLADGRVKRNSDNLIAEQNQLREMLRDALTYFNVEK